METAGGGGDDKEVRPELEQPLEELYEAIESVREEVQDQRDELDELLGKLDELKSDYGALQHDDRQKHEQNQALVAMERTLHEIQNLQNMIGSKDSLQRQAVHNMIRYIDTALKDTIKE